jgi:hypothetical protein
LTSQGTTPVDSRTAAANADVAALLAMQGDCVSYNATADLHRHLPPATPVVTPAERAAVIERRRQGVRRRFARPA